MAFHRIFALFGCVAVGISAATAQTPGGWEATRTLAGPEAHQAAAADSRFVYAIASKQIAKYDRQTGERVALSSGDATHLNSGFFWDGRLYCAHSNYPQTPERSEIKVLDVESMRLTTFKDFADFGGSLTWVLWHNDYWWCNFARYGDDNAATFLVQFTDQWKEIARFTYPRELIGRLGRYSLSGGIWDQGQLLVTGHDDPLLFRLKLPPAGRVLELVGEETIPFTGQGIARDPVTGGLVGIHRRNRQVIFASRQQDEKTRLLRVLSYNIHHAEGDDKKLDLERIAKVIRSAEPDVVALQEVDQNVERSRRVDQPAELARLTGLSAVFGQNIPLQGGGYGNAVLTRLPIERWKNHKLPRLDEGEQRGVLEVALRWPGGEEELTLLATHFDHRRPDGERLASVKAVEQLVAAIGERPMLLVGDLNAAWDSDVLTALDKTWQRPHREPMLTSPARRPARQIDYILVRPASRWRLVEIKVLDEPVASDHRPILATLELLEADERK